MDTTKFTSWLVEEKKFSTKASHDALSRLRRILSITGETEASNNTIMLAEKNADFMSMSMSVKSQMRRAVRLALEFEKEQ